MKLELNRLGFAFAFFVGLGISTHDACAQPTTEYEGLTHTILGSASLAIDPASGSLIVSNIGSSGLDGVSIDLGEAESFRCEVIGFDPGLPTTDATLNFDVIGQYGDSGLASFLKLSMTDVGLELAILADASGIGISSFTLEGRSSNLIINLSVGWDGVSAPPTTPIPPTVIEGIGWTQGSLADGSVRLLWPGLVPVSFDGAPPVMIDELRIIPEGVAAVHGYVETVNLTGSHSGATLQFTLVDEAIGLYGADHRARGAAVLNPLGGTLTVSNIGSSGLDGVSIDVGEVFEFIGELGPVVAPAGTSLLQKVNGVVDGNPDRPIVTGNMASDGAGGWTLLPDFSPIGSSQYIAEAYLDGALVGTSGPTSQSTHADQYARNYGFKVEIGGLPCDYGFDVPASVTFPGTSPVIADAVRFIPVAPTSTVNSIREVQWATSGISDITLKRGIFTPVGGNHEVGHHFGMFHDVLGGADLQLQPTDGIIHRDLKARNTLLVSNIGSSGLDGVSIDLGEADGFKCRLNLDVPSAPLKSALPIVNRTILKAYFQTGDTPTESQFESLIDSISATQIDISLDWPVGPLPTGVNVTFELDDTTVFTTSLPWPPAGPLASGDFGPVLTQQVQYFTFEVTNILRWELNEFPPTPVTFPGQTPVLADRIIFEITDAAPSSTGTTHITHVDLLGEDGAFVILNEALIHTGGVNTTLGPTRIIAGKGIGDGDDFLTVSNIGSSGEDGVSIDLDDVVSAYGPNSGGSIGCDFFMQGGVLGSESEVVVSGRDGSNESSAIATLRTLVTVQGLSITPDLLPIGSSTFDVEVLNAGVPVASAFGLSGAAALLPGGDQSLFRAIDLTGEDTSSSGVLTWTLEVRVNRIELVLSPGGLPPPPVPVDIQLPGQGTVVGDLIVITPIPPPDPTGPQVAPSQTKVLVSAMLQMDVLAERAAAVLSDCQKADTNQSGAVNVTDLLDVLASWGPCPAPCPPDITGDGQVNVTDLLDLLAAWGACP